MIFSLLVSSSLSSVQRFVIIVICLLPIAVLCESGCVVSGKFYSLGKIWHPELETRGAAICATCKCHPEGKVNCTSKACLPGTCLNPRNDPESCCASCQEVPEESSAESSSHSGQTAFSCLHNGRIYRDWQSFTTNDSGLVPSGPNQCVQCICQSGAITCELKTCPTLNCPVIIRISSHCCPICEGQPINCYSGQQSFHHGAVWHVPPVPTQRQACEECKCTYGKIECQPLRCPRSRKLCSKIPQHCCPSCKKKKNSKTTTKPSSSDKGNPAGAQMCLPAKTNTLVYRNQVSRNISGILQYLFVHSEPKSRAELHSWTLSEGKISNFTLQNLSKENIAQIKDAFKFYLLGATHQKFLPKFLQRERQLKKKCLKRCTKKIERLQGVLKLKDVKEKTQCVKGDRVVG